MFPTKVRRNSNSSASYRNMSSNKQIIPSFNMHRYSSLELGQLLKEERLPKAFKPVNYVLKLCPDLDKHYFEGTVKITISCLEATKDIILHSSNHLRISYNNIKLTLFSDTPENAREIEIPSVSKNPSAETLVLTAVEELQVGCVYELYFPFSGSYSNPGLFKKNSFAGTIFFPKHARKVFPCFDEPSFKATFDIIVGHPRDKRSLSVMPLDHTEVDPDNKTWVLDYFARTPPLSTFSINILICDFKKGDVMQISTPQGKFKLQFHANDKVLLDQQTREAVHVPGTVKFMGDFLGVGYPLPKLDVAFVYGLAFATQINAIGLMLIQEGIMRTMYIEHIPVFANLWIHHMTTPEWWTEFNLTTYLGAYLTRLSYVTLINREYWTTYGQWSDHECMYHVFGMPSFENFEATAAHRGEWFFRMLNAALTKKIFKAGLKQFFSDNLYGTFTEKLFWTTIEKQAKKDGKIPESLCLEDVAKSWLSGETYHYPMLTVTRDYNQNSGSLEQCIFLLKKPEDNELTKEEEAFIWWLPIMYLSPTKLDLKTIQTVKWMGEKSSTITDLPDANSFIIVNPADEGLFLVNYDQRNWLLICQFLTSSPSQLHYKTRRKLLSDALYLSTAGHLDLITTLNVTLFLLNESMSTVWQPMSKWFLSLMKCCRRTKVENKLYTYVRRLVAPRLKIVSSRAKKSFDDVSLVSYVGSLLSMAGSQETINTAHEAIKAKMPTYTLYDEDSLLLLFFPEILKKKPGETTEDDFEKLKIFVDVVKDSPYFQLEKSPACLQYVQRVLNSILDENTSFDTHAWYSLLQLLTSGPVIHSMTLNFFLEHFDDFKERFFTIEDHWRPFIMKLTEKVNTQEGLDKLQRLHEEHEMDLGYSLGILEDAIETAKLQVEWVNKYVPDLEFWLDQVLPQLKKCWHAEPGNVKVEPVVHRA